VSKASELPTDEGAPHHEVTPSQHRDAVAAAASLGLPALAGMLVGTDDGICVLDADGRYAYANPAACHMLGQAFSALVGENFLDSFPFRERSSVRHRLPRRTGEAFGPFLCALLLP
jgi:PAS domain-containing protein